jgi:hypothetical protein
MDPADVKRCQRAANLIRHHIEREAWEEAERKEIEVEMAAFKSAVVRGENPTPGSTAYFEGQRGYRDYRGTVVSLANRKDAILRDVKLHAEIHVTHILETRNRVYRFHPLKKPQNVWVPFYRVKH